MEKYSEGLEAWLTGLKGDQKAQMLNQLIADDCVFRSPVVHTPQEGKQLTFMYLYGASQVFLKEGTFKYTRIIEQGLDAVLEFETELDGIHINGVDMIRFNDEGKIAEFKVMLRPLKAVQKIHELMMAELAAFKKPA
ncbi:nuclear transport factor 2 family protein [Pseudovibrio sp. SPO723]|uniref:nuclear transport factor 2 family protein n=1 Tax=Nesiotobacter zosterae TaxID=392721 RepID=UPI0029C575A6|nr:nuclear transport factor 2 family protein [Pseudovibrio sp. SPO723]MDX5595332.1 nuclear transport factor 2 family protein [Pseudovibrio sp. SPO723]